jgi:hypothetical protein
MADCWKLVWKVEPAALIVPLAAAELAEALDAGAEAAADDEPAAAAEELEEELDEEHAARASAAMTAPPATAACLLPRSCIKDSPCN